jgi:hypothetical protein
LFPGDPAAADNSPGDTATTGTTPTEATRPPAGPDLSAKIAELERLNTRYQQQADGSRQEAQRQRDEVARLQGQIAAIEARLAPTAPPSASPQRPPVKRVSLVEAQQKFLLDNDDSLLRQWEEQQQQPPPTPPPGVSMDDIRKLLAETEAQRDAREKTASKQMTLQQTLVTRHPELLDVTRHAPFVNAVAQRYQELQQDPVTGMLYPPDPAAQFMDPTTGVAYDMRVLMHAAGEVKAKQPPRPEPVTLGAQGTPPAPTPTGPKVPSHLVQGPEAVLNDPAIQKALAALPGWGTTAKDQLTTLLKYTDPTIKARWQRGEVT